MTDRAVGGTRYGAADATAESPPPRPNHDHLRAPVAGELDDPPPWRSLEELCLGLDPGDLGDLQGTVEHAPRALHLLGQPSLVERRPKEPGRAAADVDEDERRAEIAGERD